MHREIYQTFVFRCLHFILNLFSKCHLSFFHDDCKSLLPPIKLLKMANETSKHKQRIEISMPHGKARLVSQEVRSDLWSSAENKPLLEGVSKVMEAWICAGCTTKPLVPSQGDMQPMLFYSEYLCRKRNFHFQVTKDLLKDSKHFFLSPWLPSWLGSS